MVSGLKKPLADSVLPEPAEDIPAVSESDILDTD